MPSHEGWRFPRMCCHDLSGGRDAWWIPRSMPDWNCSSSGAIRWAEHYGLQPECSCPNGTLEAIARAQPENVAAMTGITEMRAWQRREFGLELISAMGEKHGEGHERDTERHTGETPERHPESETGE